MTSMPPVLVLGTRNKKKLGELVELLTPHGIELKTLADYPNAVEVEETGATFAENAALKATMQARNLNLWVLGEDSGLSVDALGGEPGVYSARFAGVDATDEKNNDLLLKRLRDVPLEQRTAQYTCHAERFGPAWKTTARGAFGLSGRAAAALGTIRCSRWWSTAKRSANCRAR
jgi:XTP/dITP diphosphohydrolase